MSLPKKTIRITGEQQRQYALSVIQKIIIGGSRVWEITVRPESRSSEQNAHFHALIGDIHQQAFRGYSFEGLKAVLVSQFAAEKDEMGEPLRNPGETVWDWKRACQVYVRPSTTKFSKAEAAEFIEFLAATGAELNVTWSDRATKVYDSYRQAA